MLTMYNSGTRCQPVTLARRQTRAAERCSGPAGQLGDPALPEPALLWPSGRQTRCVEAIRPSVGLLPHGHSTQVGGRAEAATDYVGSHQQYEQVQVEVRQTAPGLPR